MIWGIKFISCLPLAVLIYFFHSCFLVTQASMLNIKSYPDKIDVYVRKTGDVSGVKIGVTPMQIEIKRIVDNFVRSDIFVLELQKEGFNPYRIVLSSFYDKDIDVIAYLQANKEFLEYRKIDQAMDVVLESSRLIRLKEYDHATNMLNDLGKKYPHLSIIPELLGNTYYITKKHKMALDYYSKAYSINPDNRDAYNMKVYLEKAMKATKPLLPQQE